MARFRLELGPVPLHHQVYLDLKAALDAREWKPGDQLPTERDLAERYGCSLITVRRALGELVREQRLERTRGRGTFVLHPRIDRDIEGHLSFTDEMHLRGMEPTTRLIAARPESAGVAVAAALNLEPGSPILDGTTRQMAILERGRLESTFIDPAAPDAPPVVWQGSWRTLEPVWVFAPHWDNYAEVWTLIDYPRLIFNTIAIALIGTIGTIFSCVLVAYGFARFKFPGRNMLFMLLIATIFLPAAVTLIPTYTVFAKIGWVGTWLPLLVPAFFANAYDVFLLRQYFMTIPLEMDEAASIDGAGPFRTLWSVLLPQALPVVVAVAIFHLVYSWNDFFGPLIYLSTEPELQPIAVGLSRLNGLHFKDPGIIQAGTLMTLVIPVIAFLLTQRFFTRGIVITGVDK